MTIVLAAGTTGIKGSDLNLTDAEREKDREREKERRELARETERTVKEPSLI